MSEAELKKMEAVVKRYPYAPSMYRFATALALNGRLSEASRIFIKLRHIHGQVSYAGFRAILRNQGTEGQPELLALEQSLPD
jgi:hypothetical protein